MRLGSRRRVVSGRHVGVKQLITAWHATRAPGAAPRTIVDVDVNVEMRSRSNRGGRGRGQAGGNTGHRVAHAATAAAAAVAAAATAGVGVAGMQQLAVVCVGSVSGVVELRRLSLLLHVVLFHVRHRVGRVCAAAGSTSRCWVMVYGRRQHGRVLQHRVEGAHGVHRQRTARLRRLQLRRFCVIARLPERGGRRGMGAGGIVHRQRRGAHQRITRVEAERRQQRIRVPRQQMTEIVGQ